MGWVILGAARGAVPGWAVEEAAVTAGVLLSCDVHGPGCEQVQVVASRSLGGARARAAAHGWSTVVAQGATLDACGACAPASAAGVVPGPRETVAERVEGLAARVRVEPAAAVVEDDVPLCPRCEAGDHWLCSSSVCGCTSSAHGRLAARR